MQQFISLTSKYKAGRYIYPLCVSGEKMFNYLKVNIKIMTNKKTFLFSFGIMLMVCLVLPFIYFWYYRNYYAYQLPAAYSVFVGNDTGLAWKYIQLIMPFLIIFPFSMSFYEDCLSGANIYYQTREGRKKYYFSQMLTCFIGGMVIIGIPFLLNILLNTIIFPLEGNDYVTTLNKYFIGWSANVTGSSVILKTISKGFILKKLYINYPQFYNVAITISASIIAGVMSVATYTFSLIVRKNRIFIFLFSYIFFQLFAMIDSVLYSRWSETNVYICTNITSYMSVTQGQIGKVFIGLYILMILIVFLEIKIVRQRIAKDEL